MAKKPTTRQMSDAQEEHIAEVFGVRRTRGSGNQFREKGLHWWSELNLWQKMRIVLFG